MYKVSCIVTLAAIGFGSLTALAEGESACVNSFDQARPQVWQSQTPCLEAKVREQVEKPRDPKLYQNGAGFYVGDGTFVMTAAHVVGGCQYFTLTDLAGGEKNAGLVSWDARRDIAVLRPEHNGSFIASDHGPGLELSYASDTLPIGQVRVAVLDLLAKKPSIKPLEPRMASPPRAVPVGPRGSIVLEGEALDVGASGSPVLDANNAVVGMVTANFPLASAGKETKAMTIATPASELAHALLNISDDDGRPLSRPSDSAVPAQLPSLAGSLVKIRCR